MGRCVCRCFGNQNVERVSRNNRFTWWSYWKRSQPERINSCQIKHDMLTNPYLKSIGIRCKHETCRLREITICLTGWRNVTHQETDEKQWERKSKRKQKDIVDCGDWGEADSAPKSIKVADENDVRIQCSEKKIEETSEKAMWRGKCDYRSSMSIEDIFGDKNMG